MHLDLRRWAWLFPATYAVHIIEELTAGGGFAAWFNSHAGAHLTNGALAVSNAIGLAAMVLGVILVRVLQWRWIVTTLGAIVLLNAAMHAAGSGITQSYSPGLISGVALWFPLGWVFIRHEWRYARRSTFVNGLIGAAVFHGGLAAAYFAVR